jgi:hypothetical protein
MRKLFIGLLLAATAASPALAGKGGHGGGPKGNPHGGGHPHGNPHAVGKHGGPAKVAARPAFHGNGHVQQAARVNARPAPVRIVRFDAKPPHKAWKREVKAERKFARQWREHVRPAPQIAAVERHAPQRAIRYAEAPRVRYVQPRVVRYVQPAVVRYAPAPVRYVTRSYAPVYYQQPLQRYYAPANYWPSSYGAEPSYGSGLGGLFGSGGDGLLGALLPVVLQSVVGGNLGGLGDLGGLGGTSALGSLTGLGTPDVLPLEQASYAPYANSGTGDLASQLPSLLGSGSLF